MGSSTIKQQKKDLRRLIQHKIQSLSPEDIENQSSIIASKALLLPEYKNAGSLSIFLSMPSKEVSTRAIVNQAFKDGKRVYVPYIHASKSDSRVKVMDMLRLRDEADLNSLQPDAWGIPSLSEDSVNGRQNALGGNGCLEDANIGNWEPPQLDLIFMPSMAFDSSLNRLGHGKGFYDRYLSLCRSRLTSGREAARMPSLVGLALSEQILPPGEALPVDALDWKVDRVVTAADRE